MVRRCDIAHGARNLPETANCPPHILPNSELVLAPIAKFLRTCTAAGQLVLVKSWASARSIFEIFIVHSVLVHEVTNGMEPAERPFIARRMEPRASGQNKIPMPDREEKAKKNTLYQASLLTFLAYILLATTFLGCTAVHERYVEKHEIKNLTVVFLDEYSLHQQWKETVGSEAVRFQPQMNSAVPLVRTVKGFFDFTSNTLYCPKWDFQVCGHELHHAALGHFHPSHE